MSDILTAERVATEMVLKARKMARTPMEVWGIPWGFPTLDKITGGIHEHEMSVLMARPGIGKTTILGQVALNVATWTKLNRPKEVVRLILCEGTAHMFQTRIACLMADVSMRSIRVGANPDELAKFEAAMQFIGDLPIEYLDEPRSLDATTEWLKSGRKCAWFGLDYLTIHPLNERAGYMHPTAIADALSQGFRLACKTIAPGLILSQMNREVEKREDQRPRLSDLRQSGQVEQDAANVFGLWRKMTGSERQEDAELLVLKHREGPLGKVELSFLPQRMQFVDVSPGAAHVEYKPYELPPEEPGVEELDLEEISGFLAKPLEF